jgi:hypothetical protein
MARLSAPRGSNSVAESETRRTGLAQVLTRQGIESSNPFPPARSLVRARQPPKRVRQAGVASW